MIKINLRGDVKEFENGTTLIEIAKSISEGLARNTLCAEVNGVTTDVRMPVTEDATVNFFTFDDNEGKKARANNTQYMLFVAHDLSHLFSPIFSW